MSIFRYVPISIAIMKIPPKLDTITCTLIVVRTSFFISICNHELFKCWIFAVLNIFNVSFIRIYLLSGDSD